MWMIHAGTATIGTWICPTRADNSQGKCWNESSEIKLVSLLTRTIGTELIQDYISNICSGRLKL